MQATVYISTEAMATVNTIINLDYYDRVSLSDEPSTDLTNSQGYYLNSEALRLAELPDDAGIVLHITPADTAAFHRHVSIPANLRGPIFSGAPNIPPDYAKKIGYWSPLILTSHHRGAVYYQNVLNAYCVNLIGNDNDSAPLAGDGISSIADTLLSDGVVVMFTGLAAMIARMDPHQFIAFTIPINTAMLGIELEGYQSEQEYLADQAQQSETMYLRIADVLASPDPDHIIISAIRNELSDYGYTY